MGPVMGWPVGCATRALFRQRSASWKLCAAFAAGGLVAGVAELAAFGACAVAAGASFVAGAAAVAHLRAEGRPRRIALRLYDRRRRARPKSSPATTDAQ